MTVFDFRFFVNQKFDQKLSFKKSCFDSFDLPKRQNLVFLEHLLFQVKYSGNVNLPLVQLLHIRNVLRKSSESFFSHLIS